MNYSNYFTASVMVHCLSVTYFVKVGKYSSESVNVFGRKCTLVTCIKSKPAYIYFIKI